MRKILMSVALLSLSGLALAERFAPTEDLIKSDVIVEPLKLESVSSRTGIRTKQETITKIYQDKNAGLHEQKIAENSMLCGSFFNDTSYRPRDIWRCQNGQEEYSIGDGTYPSDYDADGNYIGGGTTGGLIRK